MLKKWLLAVDLWLSAGQLALYYTLSRACQVLIVLTPERMNNHNFGHCIHLLSRMKYEWVNCDLLNVCVPQCSGPGFVAEFLSQFWGNILSLQIWRLHLQRGLTMERSGQTMEDMTAHDRRTTFLAIRLYHVIYTVLRTGSRWHSSSTCIGSKQSAWKTRPSISSSKIS